MLDLVQEYTGHPFDQVLNLYYAKARMYDAQDRRFVAVDTYKGELANPQTLVQYIYCNNNPLKYVDPFGLDPVPQWAVNINKGNATQADYATAIEFDKSGSISAYTGIAAKQIQSAIATAKKVMQTTPITTPPAPPALPSTLPSTPTPVPSVPPAIIYELSLIAVLDATLEQKGDVVLAGSLTLAAYLALQAEIAKQQLIVGTTWVWNQVTGLFESPGCETNGSSALKTQPAEIIPFPKSPHEINKKPTPAPVPLPNPTPNENDTKDVTIYRWGGKNPGNLTPKDKDTDVPTKGLSFSAVYKPGSATTTVGAINATGVLFVVNDGVTHYSVYPVGATLEEWKKAGSGSIWTLALKAVVW
jgi:RHS repeat-associated protein